MNESVLIITENEASAEGNQLVKLKLTGRKGELQKVKAAVIEVPLLDLAEYKNDQFNDGDRKKLQLLGEKLGQIITRQIKGSLQRVQQLFTENPVMAYDSVLLYEEWDIPGIKAWEGMKRLLSGEGFEPLRQHFSGDAWSPKGVDGDKFAKAMEGLIAPGMIDRNSAAALKIQQLARQITATTDRDEKARYLSTLLMFGKGLSEKTLLKYVAAETKTDEFQSAENNRLFGQLLLRKALKSGVTPDSIVRELKNLAPGAMASEAGFSNIRKLLQQVIATGQLPSKEKLGEYQAQLIGAYMDIVMEKFGGDLNGVKKSGFRRFWQPFARFIMPQKAAERQIEKNQYVNAATRVLSAMKEQEKPESFDELLRLLYLYSDRKVTSTIRKEENIEVQAIQTLLGAA